MDEELIKDVITRIVNRMEIDGHDVKLRDIVYRQPLLTNVVLIDTEPKLKGLKDKEKAVKIYYHILDGLELMGVNKHDYDVRLNDSNPEFKKEEDFPFEEEIIGESKIRTFDKNVLSEELVWHRDKEDRLVEVVEGDNWELQLDDELPVKLIPGKSYIIPEGVYHRVKRGNTDLKIKITKL